MRKVHKNANEFCQKVLGKLRILMLTFEDIAIVCFQTGCQRGRHFEINIKTENYKPPVLSQKHACMYTFDKFDLCL